MPSSKVSSRSVRQRLSDILFSIDEIQSFVGTMSYDAFVSDRRTYHAVVRCLEIVSESTRHLPASFKGRHSAIEWRRIADAGNIYRHAYDAVSPRRIWDTATLRLAVMRPIIAAEIARLAEK